MTNEKNIQEFVLNINHVKNAEQFLTSKGLFLYWLLYMWLRTEEEHSYLENYLPLIDMQFNFSLMYV